MIKNIFKSTVNTLTKTNNLLLNNKVYSQISFMKKGSEQKKDIQEQVFQDLQQGKDKKQIVEENLSDLLENQQNVQQEHDKQVQEMHAKHQLLSQELEKELNLPFKLYGWLEVPETKTAYMGERVFAQHRIPKHQVLSHLYKIFQGTLYSMVEQDEEFLNEYCEKQLADKLLKQMGNLKEKGYKFRVVEDVTGIGGEPVSKFYYISDMIMVRGLDVDRSKNRAQDEYHVFKDIDDMGIVIYTPNYLSQPESFVDPERNKTIYEEEYQKVIMRLLVPIKTPLRIQVFRPPIEGEEEGEEIMIQDDLYTWDHLAVFETQMKAPPKFKSFYKLENYMEWMGKFHFGTWKLVDLDNYMQGNPLIIKNNKRDQYDDPIFEGTKYDPKSHISLKNI